MKEYFYTNNIIVYYQSEWLSSHTAKFAFAILRYLLVNATCELAKQSIHHHSEDRRTCHQEKKKNQMKDVENVHSNMIANSRTHSYYSLLSKSCLCYIFQQNLNENKWIQERNGSSFEHEEIRNISKIGQNHVLFLFFILHRMVNEHGTGTQSGICDHFCTK